MENLFLEVRYHHIDAPPVNGVEVEAHFRSLFLDSPLRNWRFLDEPSVPRAERQRWFRENEQFGVCDFAVGIKTKTGKTPEGIVSNEVSEIDSKLSSSVSSLSTDSLAASYIPSGNKPKKTHSLNETDGVSKAKCFCDEGAGFVPDGGATPDRGCDGNVGLKMRACSQSQTVIGCTKSEASTTGRGFSGFCQNRIPIPTVSFNAVYQLCHIYRHLSDEGIGLRQLLDYYFVLRTLHIEQSTVADRTPSMAQWAEGMGISVMSNTEIQHVLNRCGLKGLAGAVMYVLHEVFAMPSEYLICDPDEERGKHLLDEIMLAGNFGKYDPRKGDLSNEASLHKFLRKTKRNLLLAKYYPHEALWEPWFRVFHWIWRKLELWRF